MRLGILTSHPIQYQAPWFRGLAKESEVEVFFAHRQSAAEQGRAGFGVAFDWDVDLLSGYRYQFLNNVSSQPGVGHFRGCDTPEISRIISECKFDAFIVCGWYLKSYWQAVRACRRAGVPVLVRGDSQLTTPRSWLKRLGMAWWQRRRLRQFDGFLSVGIRNREYLEHFGVRSEKIFFAPHFVDNEWFAARATEGRNQRPEVRRAWGAGDEKFVALFVGKFIPKKRPMDLLQALGTLNIQHPTSNIQVVLVGSGELGGELREFAARENVRVHFAGFKNQTELPAVYAAADALVLPSDGGETWGLVVNEAMACGLPAIVSDAAGCASDLIEAGKTGFAFPLGDTSALANRLVAVAILKQQGHDFGPALREKLAVYSVGQAVAGTLRAARQLSVGVQAGRGINAMEAT